MGWKSEHEQDDTDVGCSNGDGEIVFGSGTRGDGRNLPQWCAPSSARSTNLSAYVRTSAKMCSGACQSGCFEKAERAVIKPVDRTQPVNFEVRGAFEVQLDEFAAFGCLVERFSIRACGFPGVSHEARLEAGTDGECSVHRE